MIRFALAVALSSALVAPLAARDAESLAGKRVVFLGDSNTQAGGYVNFMADDDQDRIRANYKGNYDRLATIKRTYDPDNVFRFNQNIKPA